LAEMANKGDEMANDENADTTPYEKARAITEKALEAFKNNDDAKADKLIEEAKRVDENAVEDVREMLEEDASSEHDPAKLNSEIAKNNQG
jgi:Tfp pilus assembly protein PilF